MNIKIFRAGSRIDKDSMPCNKPRKSPNPDKKKVVKGCEDGKEKIIHFGATGYSDYTKHKDAGRRSNFRARHNCDTAKSKLTARHWACKTLWRNGGSLLLQQGGKVEKAIKETKTGEFLFDLNSAVGRKMWEGYKKSNPTKAQDMLRRASERLSTNGVVYVSPEQDKSLEELSERYSVTADEIFTSGNAGGFGMAGQQRANAMRLRPTVSSSELHSSAVHGVGTPKGESQSKQAVATNKAIDALTSFIPGYGDVKDFIQAYNTGKPGAILLAGLGVVPVAGDLPKLFKPVIKEYSSNTEMFIDILKQAEEQGIKVDKTDKLYKQIVDELPGAKEFYKLNKPIKTAEDLAAELPKEINGLAVKVKESPDYAGSWQIDLFNEAGKQGHFKIDKAGQVKTAGVKADFRKQGITTALYDHLNAAFSKEGITLRSDSALSSLGENRWKKDVAAGKAKVSDELYDEVEGKVSRTYERLPMKLNDEQISEGLYLATKTEQAQENLADSQLNFTSFDPAKVKSLFREHLAKWDWTNPNIHKALVPIGATAALLKAKQEKKAKGGCLTLLNKGGIYINPANKGKFTAKTKGMRVQEFATKVLGNKDKYSLATEKQAQFAKNAKKWN